MIGQTLRKNTFAVLVMSALFSLTVGCSSAPELPSANLDVQTEAPLYRIGPGDGLQIFFWRNNELSTGTTVRPDGMITIPLAEDVPAAGRTPTELAREIETHYAEYVQDPIVNVMVNGFIGPYDQTIRVIGEAQQPLSLPFRANMTMLDVMIAVNGLTEFADGNDATLVRLVDGEQKEYRVRLDNLVRDGDFTANVAMLPGDVLIIPESVF